MDPQEEKDIIVFGLDFGTTFSGVAWAYSKDLDSVSTVTSWATQQSHCSDKDKTPTVLSFEDVEKPAWGYQATSGGSLAKWFKLLLLAEKDVPLDVIHSGQYIQARQMMEKLQKTPTDVVACYVSKLWNHTLGVISRSESTEFLDICEFHIVVTLPAIWPEYAKKRMASALESSGILKPRIAGPTSLRFISEPEAAALATINDLSKRPTLKPGHTMIICDAGGGTVDLITYEIQQVRPFVVTEIVKGDGELCGGVFLDEAFIDFIKDKIGLENWELIEEAEKQKFINYEWENGIKPQFSNTIERDWLVSLPEPQQQSSHDGSSLKRSRSLEITMEDLRQIFDHVTERIVELIKRQANTLFAKTSKKPNFVVLVGGFGRCHYLYDRVRNVATEFDAILLQSQGSKPWSAISRGAVIQGLTKLNLTADLGVTVSSRIARLSYGVKFSRNFIQDEHHEEDKSWYESEGVYKANDQLRWFLNKGEDVDDHEPVQFKFYNIVNKEQWEEMKEAPLAVYCTEMSPAPTRAKDPNVGQLCTIDWAGVVDYRRLPKWKNAKTGIIYRKLEYTVLMSCDLGVMEFSIIWNGQKHGASTGINVGFETSDA